MPRGSVSRPGPFATLLRLNPAAAVGLQWSALTISALAATDRRKRALFRVSAPSLFVTPFIAGCRQCRRGCRPSRPKRGAGQDSSCPSPHPWHPIAEGHAGLAGHVRISSARRAARIKRKGCRRRWRRRSQSNCVAPAHTAGRLHRPGPVAARNEGHVWITRPRPHLPTSIRRTPRPQCCANALKT